MKNLLIIMFLKASLLTFSQSNDSSYTKDSDVDFWLNYKQAEEKRFNLTSIPIDADRVFKFSTYCTSLLVSKKNQTFEGNITIYVEEVEDYKDSVEIFKKEFKLNALQTEKIFELIDSLKILSIASDKYIDCWEKGFDGISYILEYKDKEINSFKNYWTPKSQTGCEKAQTIQKLVDSLYSITDRENLQKVFEQENPFNGCRCPGSPSARVKILTPETYRQYLKEKKEYLKKRKKNRKTSGNTR